MISCTHQAKNQYSAAYCLEKAVGIPAHVAGAAPPAVFTLYISFTLGTRSFSSIVSGATGLSTSNFSQGTALLPSGPIAAVAGAVTLEVFFEKKMP